MPLEEKIDKTADALKEGINSARRGAEDANRQMNMNTSNANRGMTPNRPIFGQYLRTSSYVWGGLGVALCLCYYAMTKMREPKSIKIQAPRIVKE